MAVAIDADGADSVVNGSATASYTGLTVGVGSNRALVVSLQTDTQTTTPPTLTWDSGGTNQVVSLIGSQAATLGGSTNGKTWHYGLVNPTSGNKTLDINIGVSTNFIVQASSVTGADQTGGATTFKNFTSAEGHAVATTSISVTSATGELVFGAAVDNGAGVASMDNTQIYAENGGATINGGANRAAGAASVTLTITPNSSSDAVAICGFSIAAAGGGGGGDTLSQQILVFI